MFKKMMLFTIALLGVSVMTGCELPFLSKSKKAATQAPPAMKAKK